MSSIFIFDSDSKSQTLEIYLSIRLHKQKLVLKFLEGKFNDPKLNQEETAKERRMSDSKLKDTEIT